MIFFLDKWYLDAVSDDGHAAIAYHVGLRVAGLSLCIGSVLERTSRGVVSQRSRAVRVPPINQGKSGFAWVFPELDFHARWDSVGASPGECTLFEHDRNAIRWTCLAPNARATIHSRGESWSGRGYVERLSTTLAPWRMPIDCLWWGRFNGPKSSVVWIRWDGPHPLTLVLLDGAEVQGAVVEDQIEAGAARLDIDAGATIRDGDIAATLLGELPIARHFAKRARWGMLERKWLSRGTLIRPDSSPESGWVIHERVWFRTRLGGRGSSA